MGDFFEGMGFPLIGGALDAVGSVVSSAMNIGQQNKMMAWQEQMANTAHQREVADLRAAGLNPVLSAMKGSGAPMPQAQQAQVGNALEGMGKAFSAAGEQRRAQELQDANIEAILAQKGKAIAETYESRTRADNNIAQKSLAELEAEYFGPRMRLAASLEDLQRSQARYNEWLQHERSMQEVGGSFLGQTLREWSGGKRPSLGNMWEHLSNKWFGPGDSAGRGGKVPDGGATSAKSLTRRNQK